MGKYVKTEDIVVGFEFYCVLGLGHQSAIRKHIVTEGVHPRSEGHLFAYADIYINDNYEYHDYFSLQDKNIIPNDYNDHECFTCLAMAQRYQSYLKNGGSREGWHKIMGSVTKAHPLDFGF